MDSSIKPVNVDNFTMQGQLTALSLTNNKFTTYNRERSISFHPYYQVRYYLPTTHFCRPHRYGPFARWLLSSSLRTERSPSPSPRLLACDGEFFYGTAAVCGSPFGLARAASSCCGSRPQDDPKGFEQLAISIPGLKLHTMYRAALSR